MKKKIQEWLWRYVPLEITGTITAFLAAYIGYLATDSLVVSAIAGTWGENAGFYGYSSTREVLHYFRSEKHKTGLKRVMVVFFKSLRNMIVEFGPSELFDSFLLRPLFMYWFQTQLGFGLGLIAGKLCADLFFYLFAIMAYEVRKKVFID